MKILGSAIVVCAAVVALVTTSSRASAQLRPCRWVANPPYVSVAARSRVPILAVADYGGESVPVPAPRPSYVWNPDLTRHGFVRPDARGDDSSIVTVSGGGCTPTRVAVFVYTSGLEAQRSIAIDYGDSQAHDELSSGTSGFGTASAHGEFAEPFGLRRLWLSGDLRTIGYEHRAGDVADVGSGGRSLLPTFGVRDTSFEARTGYQIGTGGPVAELAYLTAASNTARPTVGGLGLALEIPPQLEKTFGAYGALAYYPNVTGGGVRYRAVRFRAGLTLSLLPFLGRPYYFELAAVGDRRSDASRAPGAVRFQGLLAGFGYRFGSRL